MFCPQKLHALLTEVKERTKRALLASHLTFCFLTRDYTCPHEGTDDCHLLCVAVCDWNRKQVRTYACKMLDVLPKKRERKKQHRKQNTNNESERELRFFVSIFFKKMTLAFNNYPYRYSSFFFFLLVVSL